MKTSKFFPDLIAVLAICFALVFWISPQISYYDDEFIVFSGYFKRIREYFLTPEAPLSHSLQLYGYLGELIGPIYIRSYHYLGWPQTIFLLPLLKIYPSVETVRFLSFISLAVLAIFISRAYRLRLLAVFIVLVCFTPWSFQHLIDLGQVTLQFPLAIWALLWFRDSRTIAPLQTRTIIYSLLTGLGLFIGLWVKLSFIFLLPGIALAGFFSILQRIKIYKLKPVLAETLILTIAFAIPTCLLFSATQQNGKAYLSVITSNTSSGHMMNLLSQYEHFKEYFAPLFINPAYTAHFVKSVPFSSFSYLSLLYISLTLILLISYFQINLDAKKSSLLYFCCTVITLILINSSERSYGIHHLVFICPFLLLFVLEIFKAITNPYLKKLLVLNISLFALVWVQILKLPDASANRDVSARHMIESLQESSKPGSHVLIVGWGACFGSAVLMPKDIIVDCIFQNEKFSSDYQFYLNKILSSDLQSKIVISRPGVRLIDKIEGTAVNDVSFKQTAKFGSWYEFTKITAETFEHD